jgi:hypothetical protein
MCLWAHLGICAHGHTFEIRHTLEYLICGYMFRNMCPALLTYAIVTICDKFFTFLFNKFLLFDKFDRKPDNKEIYFFRLKMVMIVTPRFRARLLICAQTVGARCSLPQQKYDKHCLLTKFEFTKVLLSAFLDMFQDSWELCFE